MNNKFANTKLVVAYGGLSFIILLMGSINAAYTYYTKGSIPPLTEASIWMGVIGLGSAAAAAIEICSNIEEPLLEDRTTPPNTQQKPSPSIEKKSSLLQNKTHEFTTDLLIEAPSAKKRKY